MQKHALANLVLVVTKSSIQLGEFPKLSSFVIVLTFGNRGGLLKSNETRSAAFGE